MTSVPHRLGLQKYSIFLYHQNFFHFFSKKLKIFYNMLIINILQKQIFLIFSQNRHKNTPILPIFRLAKRRANVIFFARFWKSERKSTRLSITNSTKIHTMNFAKKDIPIIIYRKTILLFPLFYVGSPYLQ